MKTWDAWFPDVLVHARTAPDPLVRQALCRAAREFLRRTRAWMEWMDAVVTVGSDGMEYDFEIPAQAQLLRVERASANGNPLEVKSYREQSADWTRYPEGERSLISRDLASFTLAGQFATGEQVQVQASFIPTLSAKGLPDDLADRHFEVITEGAKSILMLTPGTEFYSPDLAAVARAQFDRGIASASFDAYRGHTNQVPRATVRWC